MVGLSLLDKSQNTSNVFDKESAKKGVNTGIRIVALALLVGIVAGFFVNPLKNLALEAIYVPIMMFILIGLILIFNNTQKKMNVKAILIEKGLFQYFNDIQYRCNRNLRYISSSLHSILVINQRQETSNSAT